LPDGKFCRVLAPEDAGGIESDQAVALHRVTGVAREAAGRREFPVLEDAGVR
jgi:hypothetical protein